MWGGLIAGRGLFLEGLLAPLGGIVFSHWGVFSRLPSRLASRTHFGAYAEGSSRFPFPSTGLLMDASHTHRLHYPSARLICSFVCCSCAPVREIKRDIQNRAVKNLPCLARSR